MKKLLLAAFVVATFATTAFAEPTKVNYLALKNFAAEFKKASDVSWSTTGEFVKATFVADNQRMEAFYTLAGEKIGTSRGISIDELPLKAKRAFAKKYESYNVKESILFEGTDEDAYFIKAENDAEEVIVKVSEGGSVSVFKRNKK
ncbi:hypothetical protein [Segetibacter aerophilus]|uniref:Beta-lactamase-inhibitor-like PepSY-like domain-containing protein n=1 Tax=Segetibacter aerophilus TaxID=670293 RepID=A0A512BBY3_9BACT|nr:hypothetical protein [Segetibacter aerophilus]GEO09415.1 hypothetical protein SAE01_19110 [Segetibacter aerophilus]